ncbi:MAG: SigF/SigG family RNA polymerase sporulation sigma factor [bacterium]|nr:SigF/SigG family RNA polymerase sporulation sigma factor [bacterium]
MKETMKLIQRAHDGDKEARDRLVTENVGLVWSIVRHLGNRRQGCEIEDLFQIGSIGLMKAIDKFDLRYQVQFSTYAVPMIAGEIRRFLRDDGMIKVSRSVKDLGLRIRTEREKLTGSLGREPTIEEIAEHIGISREEVAAGLEAGAQVESLYSTVGGDNGGSPMYLIDKVREEGSEHEELLNRILVKEVLQQLEERDRELIVRRYFDNQTQSQIAQAFGISQVQVSRLEKKILKQLRALVKMDT